MEAFPVRILAYCGEEFAYCRFGAAFVKCSGARSHDTRPYALGCGGGGSVTIGVGSIV